MVLGSDRARSKFNGRVIETDWAMMVTVRDGKIARFRDYTDTVPMMVAVRGSCQVSEEET